MSPSLASRRGARARAFDWPPTGTALTVFAFSLIALAVRIKLAARSGLWGDEAAFAFIVRLPSWGAMMDFLELHESHPPLFYALMRIWFSIAGDSDAAAVALPIAFGVALVPAIYFVGASLFSSRAGLIAAGLAAVSPALSDHAATARPYSLLPLLALLSTYALIRGLERGARKPWVAYSLATLGMLYTHHWAWLVFGGQCVAAMILLSSGLIRASGGAMRQWLIACSVIAVGYLPWVRWLVYQSSHAGHPPNTLNGAGDIAAFVTGGLVMLLQATILSYAPAAEGGATRFGAIFIVLLGACLLLRGRMPDISGERGAAAKHFQRAALILLLLVPVIVWAAALVLSLHSNLLLARCFVTLAPLLLLTLAYWIDQPRTGPQRRLVLIGVVFLLTTYGVGILSIADTPRSNARELARIVSENSKQSDLLIVAPGWIASSFNRYYASPTEQIDFPHFGRQGAFDYAKIRDRTASDSAFGCVQQRIEQAKSAGRRVWFITERGLVHEFSPGGLERTLESPSYFDVGVARANQIRESLTARFGQPDTSISVHSRLVPIERLRAFLFEPQGIAPDGRTTSQPDGRCGESRGLDRPG